MAKFLCLCGEVVTTSGPMPNPLEWLLISDESYDRVRGSKDVESLYESMAHAFRCPTSGHLFVYWDGMDQEATIYQPSGKGG
jgi:hypothetical protein